MKGTDGLPNDDWHDPFFMNLRRTIMAPIKKRASAKAKPARAKMAAKRKTPAKKRKASAK